MGKPFTLRPLVPIGVTGTDTAAGYDPAYVANDHMGVIWSSVASPANAAVTLDLGANVACDTAMLFGIGGAPASAGLQIIGARNGDAGFAAPVTLADQAIYAGAEMPTHGRGVALWQAAGALPHADGYRYWRFRFVNLGTGGSVQVARIALGRRLVLERGYSFGAGFGLRDLGGVDFSPRGVMLRRRAPKLRTLGVSFAHVHKDEVEAKVQPLIEQVGGQEPVGFMTDDEPHAMRQRRAYFGPFTGDLGTVQRTARAWEWRANLVDLLAIPKAG